MNGPGVRALANDWTPTWYNLDPLVLMRMCVERHEAVVMESFESVFKYLECGEYIHQELIKRMKGEISGRYNNISGNLLF